MQTQTTNQPTLITDIEDETNASTFGLNLILATESSVPTIEPVVSIDPIPALPAVIIPKKEEITSYGGVGLVKPKFPLDLVPFHEVLEVTSVHRVKSWAQRLTMSTRRIYIHYRKINKAFYWDIRNKDEPRNSTLFGPFESQEAAHAHMTSHYKWGGNVIERID